MAIQPGWLLIIRWIWKGKKTSRIGGVTIASRLFAQEDKKKKKKEAHIAFALLKTFNSYQETKTTAQMLWCIYKKQLSDSQTGL